MIPSPSVPPVPSVVSARDLSIEYSPMEIRSRLVAIRGVTFDLAAGEILGVIGASGSGKSTLARVVAGYARSGGLPGSVSDPAGGIPAICGGSLVVLGTSLREIRAKKRAEFTRGVGYLRQDGAEQLNSSISVADIVAEPLYLRNRGLSPRDVGQAVATLIDAVHLPLAILDRRPWELSSGQRQRVALARALILEPTLFVADEPIRGVDLMMRKDVLRVIPELQAERHFSALVVSHDLAVITEVAHRVVVMHDGVIIRLGPLEKLTEAAEHPYLKSLAKTMQQLR